MALRRVRCLRGNGTIESAWSGGVVPRFDQPLIDDLLKHAWFVLPLTWLMVAGACNAISLIDDAHGLAGGTAVIHVRRRSPPPRAGRTTPSR